MEALRELMAAVVAAIVRAFVPALVKEVKDGMADTCEDSRPDAALTERLQDRIRQAWNKTESPGTPPAGIRPGRFGSGGPRAKSPGRAALGMAACLFLSGCGVKTVYVPDGTPVRIREAIKAVKVWVMDADGKPKASVMDIPAGWYALSDPGTAR